MNVNEFLGKENEKLIAEAIGEAEKKTSGEIRVHIENHCSEDVLDRAAVVFRTLSLHKTKERNGVLFYVAVKDHKFAIIGDLGINAVVSKDFWNSTKEMVIDCFKEGNYAQGLITGIKKAGELLQQYFPYHKNDTNELSDEISYGIE